MKPHKMLRSLFPFLLLLSTSLAAQDADPTPEGDRAAVDEPLFPDFEVQDEQDGGISVKVAEDRVREKLFGPGKALELTVDAALAISETNNLGLEIEDVNTEVARFNASGSWGAFDWVFDAGGRYVSSKSDGFYIGGSQIVPGSEQQNTAFDLGFSRPLRTGGTFALTFNTEQERTWRNPSGSQPGSTSDRTTDSLGVTFTQPLLRGFGVDYATSTQREQDVLYLKQLERRREVRQRLLGDVHDAYWELVRTRQQLEIAAQSLDLGLEQLERNRRMLDAGVGTEVEVIQAEAEVAKRIETLLSAEVAMHVSGDALKALLFPGKDPASWETELVPITALPEDTTVEVAPWDQLLAVASEYRPELRQQRLEIDAAEIRHERAVSERYLGLDLELSATGAGEDDSARLAAEESWKFTNPRYVAGLRFNAPINNRTRRFAEHAARSRMRAAHLAFDQVMTQVVGEVRNAVRQVAYQSESVRAAGKSLEAARRQLEAEEARYRNDLSTNFQVLEYQLRLAEAMNSEQTARVNYAKSLYQLQVVQGTVGEPGR